MFPGLLDRGRLRRVWMTLSILAWLLFWVALNAWGTGQLSEDALLQLAWWLGPVLAALGLGVRLWQSGFRPWWRLGPAERVAKTRRAAWLFSVLGFLLFTGLEGWREDAPGQQPLWLRLLLHGVALLVLLWLILPYSTLLDVGELDEGDESNASH
ncbi:MAG: hypothetical protein CSA62_00515 [Planctomycetota bacterium]|nr:MAG: hypothetical protein CSA62_00515 [Planctomycetota bacterium]